MAVMQPDPQKSLRVHIEDAVLVAHAWLTRPRLTPPCAIHGIQRSGTNYLAACLRRLSVTPINDIVRLKRQNPWHKHFRWYADKSAMPPYIARNFSNDFVVADLSALNAAARYPRRCVHLVMHKPRIDWLVSACNWGLRGTWFSDKEAALNDIGALMRDYDTYYGFWYEMAAQAPGQVAVLDLYRVQNDFDHLLATLKRVGIRYRRAPGVGGHVDQVAQSLRDRSKPVSREDVLSRLSETDQLQDSSYRYTPT